MYIEYMIPKHILLITFLNEPELFYETQLYSFIDFYQIQIFYFLSIICLHTLRFFQVLLCIINNSTEYQSFVYTQLNNQTVLFQTIQFSINQQNKMVPSIAMYHKQFNE